MFKQSLGAIAALGLMAGTAQAVTIDTFNTDPSTTITGDPAETVASGSAIGGFRTIEVTSGSGTEVDIDGGDLSEAASMNALGHSQSVNTVGSSLITWDANGAGLDDSVGAAGYDLTDGGTQDAIQLDVIFIDQGSVALTFTVQDTASNVSELLLSGLTTGSSAFAFSDFDPVTTTGADFTAITSVSLAIDAGNSSDLLLDLVQTRQGTNIPGDPVPSPAALALLGAGLLGFGAIRRRK